MVWLAVSAFLLLSARSTLLAARGDLRAIRDDVQGSALLEGSTRTDLADIEHRLHQARDRVRSPLVTPFRALPVIGRQIRSVDALALAAADATGIASDTLDRLGETLDEAEAPDTDRIQLARTLADIARDATDALDGLDLGPDRALIGPLRDAREEFADDLADLTSITEDVEVAATGVAQILDSNACYLLFAANNAEMRAGSGMFLQAGELCFDGGKFSLGDLQSTSDLTLPAEAVQIRDPDLRDRWGLLLPNAEYRNLALSPRFDANAELAVDMWHASSGHEVDGVLAVDPVALEALLQTTGPIEVEGQRYAADDVVDELLVKQYEGFLDPGYDTEARRERLGRVAKAAVQAFDSGGWNAETLVDALPDAVAGRHLLAWSRDPDIQASFESMGIAGVLEERSLAVSVLNRGGSQGGGKLDPALRIDAKLSIDASPAGGDGLQAARLRVEITNTTPEGTPTYIENPEFGEVRYGVYAGILAVNLPGFASDGRIDGVDGLYVVGADGPTRVVATRFELGPEQTRAFTIRFEVPAGIDSIVVEPSARIPPIRWTWRNRNFRDLSSETISW